MARKRKPPYISHELSVDEQLKLIADHIYTEAEENIQACIDSENYRGQVVERINEVHRHRDLGPSSRMAHIYQLPWR